MAEEANTRQLLNVSAGYSYSLSSDHCKTSLQLNVSKKNTLILTDSAI